MTVDTETSPHRVELEGTVWHFCSARCGTRFGEDPQRFLDPARKAAEDALAAAQAPAGATWTCPMHPDIQRQGPGTCPVCGMGLEPAEPGLDDGPNPELVDMSRRFRVSAALAGPLLVLTMTADLLGWHPLPMRTFAWLQLALATPVGCGAGCPSSSAAGHRCAAATSTCSL
jgi:Cu+-exporting ATPase